jgi:hypothetical protein
MVRICIFGAITAVVLVSPFGCGQQGASNTPSGSTEQATTSPTESPEPHTTTEETIIAGEESTQATETTEETIAFQVQEGTRTSSTARIACLRADQGASPLPMSTEALNGDVLTRVRTPKVAAQPDGVHYQIDNRLSQAADYSLSNGDVGTTEELGTAEKGISNHVSERPPSIAKIKCNPTVNYDPAYIRYAHFEIVVGNSGYKSLELGCKPGATPSFTVLTASRGGSEFDLVSNLDPVGQAREQWSKRLKEGDVVEAAGYPEAPDSGRPVRVVRNGKVVATIDYDEYGYYETYCDGQF